jgi:hypothetical protein
MQEGPFPDSLLSHTSAGNEQCFDDQVPSALGYLLRFGAKHLRFGSELPAPVLRADDTGGEVAVVLVQHAAFSATIRLSDAMVKRATGYWRARLRRHTRKQDAPFNERAAAFPAAVARASPTGRPYRRGQEPASLAQVR